MAHRALVHPDRQITGMKPIKAWRRFRQLVAKKEDPEQVFHGKLGEELIPPAPVAAA